MKAAWRKGRSVAQRAGKTRLIEVRKRVKTQRIPLCMTNLLQPDAFSPSVPTRRHSVCHPPLPFTRAARDSELGREHLKKTARQPEGFCLCARVCRGGGRGVRLFVCGVVCVCLWRGVSVCLVKCICLWNGMSVFVEWCVCMVKCVCLWNGMCVFVEWCVCLLVEWYVFVCGVVCVCLCGSMCL